MSTSRIEEVVDQSTTQPPSKSPLNDSQDIFINGTKDTSPPNTEPVPETFNTELLFGEKLRQSFKNELLEAIYLFSENVVPRLEALPADGSKQEAKLSYCIKPGVEVKLSGSWLTALLFNTSSLTQALCAVDVVDIYSGPEMSRTQLKPYEVNILKMLFDVRTDLKEPKFLVDFVGRVIENPLPLSGTTAIQSSSNNTPSSSSSSSNTISSVPSSSSNEVSVPSSSSNEVSSCTDCK